MKIIGVIPARYASTRFPGKPLAQIQGKPMIQWVYERASLAKSLKEIIVATDDQRIYDTVRQFEGNVVLTSTEHTSGTERIAEAVKDLDVDIVVNIQGDEPLIDPQMIEQVISSLISEPELVMATLKQPVSDSTELSNPNIVKVVTDINDFALYFSRSVIPFIADETSLTGYFKHIGLYVYRKAFLLKLVSLPITPLERTERLEQLRVLENGYKIKVSQTAYYSIGVDTWDDIEKVKRILERGETSDND